MPSSKACLQWYKLVVLHFKCIRSVATVALFYRHSTSNGSPHNPIAKILIKTPPLHYSYYSYILHCINCGKYCIIILRHNSQTANLRGHTCILGAMNMHFATTKTLQSYLQVLLVQLVAVLSQVLPK